MGITNFCKLIDPISPPTSEPRPFDSVLVDCQSFLYVAIEHCLQSEEDKIFDEVCESTWNQLLSLLKLFLPYDSENWILVLSFDGEGVPMKFATQRDRRKIAQPSKKAFYRYVLFGNNALTLRVQAYLLEKLKTCDWTLKIVLCGCNVPGEGEHKIFQLAEVFPNCRNPVVVSVDQDVFILSFLRLDRYDTIQIYRYKKFYDVKRLVLTLPYPLKHLVDVSFLFGNDFIPVLVGISPNNVPKIHRALTFDEEVDPPATLSTFLRNMDDHIRFDRVEFVDRRLLVCYWMTYFWILDYYTKRKFQQQFLENRVYDAFDRNQLLTGLEDEEYSRETYRGAKTRYEEMLTQPEPHAERKVFTDEALLDRLKAYWTKPENGRCTVLKLTSSKNRRRKSPKLPPTDTETPLKMVKT